MMQNHRPLLIVFGGLPGTGKTTVSTLLAAKLGAVYVRIDTIEQAMRAAGTMSIGAAGYDVANAIAVANLPLGHAIVIDCVNPVRASRLGWQTVAGITSARLVNIHLVCSDAVEHRRRVEGRTADVPGHVLPTWEAVMRCELDARDDEHLLLDTSTMSLADSVARCDAYISNAIECR